MIAYPAYVYIVSGLILLNIITFLMYGMDKRAATNRDGAWRVPEASLLLLALLGGSPAAWYARRYYRHKTNKADFVTRFWLVVLIQICVIVYLVIQYCL